MVTDARRVAPAWETRSIDQIPASERHGVVWHQGPFWFAGAFVLTSLATGFIGPSLGLGLWWSLIAIVAGMGFGTLFMAFHANQGPRLGIPQMIQSRAQFGSRGAIIPLAMAVFIYVAYNVFGYLLAREIIDLVAPDSAWWYVLFVAVAFVISVWGYDLVHMVQRYMAYIMSAIFLVVTVYAIAHLHSAAIVHGVGGFAWKAFVVEFAATAAYQISYAIYVSDYTRYLPATTPARKLISWTFLGAWIGAAWMACLGALIAVHVAAPNPVASVASLGNSLTSGFGTAVVLLSGIIILTTNAMNNYGATLTALTAVDGFGPIRPTARARFWGVLGISIVSLAVTAALPGSFISDFTTFLNIMLYLVIPWTAVNLTDFYFVRKGNYDVAQLFDPRGIYHRWNWQGLTAYLAGFAAMVPFWDQSFYVGPMVSVLGGADLSFVPGLIVAAGVYWLLTRRRTPAAAAAAVAAVPSGSSASAVGEAG